jgi:TrmH family RNA methyltransferase
VPDFPRITSRQHDIVKRFRTAARRASADAVLLDGEHLLAEALDARVPIDVVLTDQAHAKIVARARASGATVYDASPGVIEAASPVRTPSGIVALARWQQSSVADVLRSADPLVIGLCGVQDPGNVGSAIRAADAFGATGVFALDETAHPAGWKALRGAMGSTFHLPVGSGTLAEAVAASRSGGLQVVATVTGAGGQPADAADFTLPTLLLLGSEGSGLPREIVERADRRVTIPMRPRVNSLNVAATAAVLLYEARRQRMA